MTADLSRRIEHIVRLGTIAEVDFANAKAKVKSGGLLTDWLPWTCVSNCNHQKGSFSVNDIENFMNIHRNEIERIQYFLGLHKISTRWVTDYRLCRLVLGDKVGIYGGLTVHWNGWELVVV